MIAAWVPVALFAGLTIVALAAIAPRACIPNASPYFQWTCVEPLPAFVQVGPVDLVRGFALDRVDGVAGLVGFAGLGVLVAVVGARRLVGARA